MAFFLAVFSKASCSAESPPAKQPPPIIRLPLVDGRYDQNKLREFFGAPPSSQTRYRVLGNQDRLGLVALELLGKIGFELSDSELVIERKAMPKWELMKVLAPPKLIGVENLTQPKEVVLFVHGLEGGGSTFASAMEYCQDRGIDSLAFDYPNDGPPDEIGGRMAEQLVELREQFPGVRVHIVAHSLGGLVSTWAVTERLFPADMVPHVVTLGTPFRGSALAEFHDELELYDVVYRLAARIPGGLDTIHDGRGEAAEALDPDSDFLRQLHRRPRPPGIHFHLAAGTHSFLSGDRRSQLARRMPDELKRLSVSQGYAGKISKLLMAKELQDGEGDGAVTLASALGLPNPSSQTTFPLTHLGLVSSKEPLEWALQQCGLTDLAKPPAK